MDGGKRGENEGAGECGGIIRRGFGGGGVLDKCVSMGV